MAAVVAVDDDAVVFLMLMGSWAHGLSWEKRRLWVLLLVVVVLLLQLFVLSNSAYGCLTMALVW